MSVCVWGGGVVAARERTGGKSMCHHRTPFVGWLTGTFKDFAATSVIFLAFNCAAGLLLLCRSSPRPRLCRSLRSMRHAVVAIPGSPDCDPPHASLMHERCSPPQTISAIANLKLDADDAPGSAWVSVFSVVPIMA